MKLRGFGSILDLTQRISAETYQVFLRINKVASVITGQFVVRTHANCIYWTGFFAHPAEHTAQHVDVELQGELLRLRVRVLTGRNMDTVRRTVRCAEHTSGATDISVLFHR